MLDTSCFQRDGISLMDLAVLNNLLFLLSAKDLQAVTALCGALFLYRSWPL